METFELSQLVTEQRGSEKSYHEFLRVPAMNAGIYVLEAGQLDPQQPHEQDEIYYVIEGRALFSCDGHDDRPASAGSIIYVPAGLGHRFHSITEDLTLLVVFAG